MQSLKLKKIFSCNYIFHRDNYCKVRIFAASLAMVVIITTATGISLKWRLKEYNNAEYATTGKL